MATIKFKISGLHCMGCVRNNERALSSLAGVRSVKIDLPTEAAEVKFDEKTLDEGKIKQAVRDNGYDAQ